MVGATLRRTDRVVRRVLEIALVESIAWKVGISLNDDDVIAFRNDVIVPDSSRHRVQHLRGNLACRVIYPQNVPE